MMQAPLTDVVQHVAIRPVRREPWPLIKRVLDAGLAAILLLLLLPLLLTVAVMLRLESPGPVIFRQERRGRNGRRFTVLKFRTMHTSASSEPHRQYVAALAAGKVSTGGLQKLTNDPRVTLTGAVLRRSSIDELPQLVNVMRGDMSLVGPRPALEYELDLYDERHFERFSVRPGLTGLWQVRGRSELGFREMLDLDVEYARTIGPRLDAQILLRTPVALVRGRAA